jgi:hypothetical protein
MKCEFRNYAALVLGIGCFLFLSAKAPSVWAETTKKLPEKIIGQPHEKATYVLDGKAYTRERLIGDFIQVAFPHYAWAEVGYNRSNPVSQINIFGDSGVDAEGDIPAFDSVSRWNKPIKIGFVPPKIDDSPLNVDLLSFKKRVHEHIEGIKKVLEKITGQPVEILDDKDIRYAGIVIYPEPDLGPVISLKFQPLSGGSVWASDASGLPDAKEISSRYSLRFTPSTGTQVEGLINPDKENNIEFANCHIWGGFKDNLFKPLVTECVLRALGFPDMILSNSSAVLGHWNAAYDRYAFNWFQWQQRQPFVWQNDAAYTPEVENLLNISATKGAWGLLHKDKDWHWPMEIADQNIIKGQLTEYDVAMLSLLYCKNIKPGMGRHQVMSVLSKSPECFKGLTTLAGER